jgi:Flp pilus assembly protein TadB
MIAALLAGATVVGVAWRWRPFPVRLATLIAHRPAAIPAGTLVAVAGVVAVALFGVPLGLAAALAVVVVRRWRAQRAARRRDALVRRHLPDVVELLAAAVDAGCTLAVAIPLLAPLAPEPFGTALAAVARRQRHGERVADALGTLADRLGAPVVSVVAALAGCERNGLPLAPTLARLAADARNDRRRQAEAAARALPVRLSFPLVLCLLPAFVLLGIVPAMAPAIQGLHLSEHPLPSSSPAVRSSP